MIEEFEYNGVWWLPDKPEKRICGTLRFTQSEGAVLDLIGSLKYIQDMNKTLEPEIILGVSSNGKNISLHKCFETKSTLSVPGFQTSSLYANIVFVGAHFQRPEDIKFKRLLVHYSHLDEWVNISGFDLQHDKGGVVIKYKLPESVEATISDDLKVLINIRASDPTHSIVQKEASIRQKTYIGLEPSKERSFEEYLNIMYNIKNFLTLGVGEPVYPLTIEGITEANKTIEKDKNYPPPVGIFYKLPDIPKVSKALMPFDMFFLFKDISEQFETFLNTWFSKEDILKPVYDLYFGMLYNPRMYLEHRFLSLVQAIESYHRRTMNNFELPEEQHKNRIAEILNAVPHGHKDWLKNKLAYSNEPNLRRRLKEILEKFADVLNKFIPDKDFFIHRVVTTRNYLTHYDETLKEQSAEGEELYHFTQKLKILLEICLLKELGVTSDIIKSLISRNRRYLQEIRI